MLSMQIMKHNKHLTLGIETSCDETAVSVVADGREVLDFLHAFRAENAETPVVVVPTTYAQFTEEELQAAGANIVIYANHMLRAAYKAMVETAHEILQNHRALEASEHCAPIQDILALVKEAEL